MNILDHIGLKVADYGRSRRFYEQALAPLGITAVMQVTREQTGEYEGTGFGKGRKPSFWISPGGKLTPAVHIAFTAESHAAVEAFYSAAIAAGGRDNGAPGPRPHYHADYFGAFVLDPDGHNIEAVCHRPG